MSRIFLLILSAVIFFSCTSPSGNSGEAAKTKPNILFIFADDQTFNTINGMGNPGIYTPNLNRLVKKGMTFTHTYNQGSWSGAVCVVSRAMLNSGRYIYHARQDINRVPLWGQVLGEAGYSTFLTGKWHNGNATALKSFQQAKSIGKGMFETKGGTKGPGYYRPGPGKNSWTPYDTSLTGHWTPQVKDIVHTDSGKIIGKPYVVRKHTSELYADNAISFLESHVKEKSGNPFFMYVAFNAPHDPRQSPASFVDMYPLERMAMPKNYMPEHPFDQGERNTLRDEILAPFPRTENVVKTHQSEYYAIISHMDQQIGRILDALEASGEADNTYIIFSADHGLAVGSHGLMGKQNQYEHSIRVPMIFCGPGIQPNSKNHELIYIQNIFATTCDMAGIPVPDHVEFKSLMPMIQGKPEKGYSAIFGSYKDYQRMIRTRNYKLIVYPKAQEVQLFDMKEDFYENNDLADKPEYADTVASLHKQLLALQKEVGDTLDISALPPL